MRLSSVGTCSNLKWTTDFFLVFYVNVYNTIQVSPHLDKCWMAGIKGWMLEKRNSSQNTFLIYKGN